MMVKYKTTVHNKWFMMVKYKRQQFTTNGLWCVYAVYIHLCIIIYIVGIKIAYIKYINMC